MLDFNKKGNQYQFTAGKSGEIGFGNLSIVSESFLGKMEKIISEKIINGTDSEKSRADGLYASLEKYKSALFFSKRIFDFQEDILSTKINRREVISIPAIEACIIFESFLYHARASLDKICLFITRQHGGNSDKYSKITKSLEQIKKSDERAEEILNHITKANKYLSGILLDKDNNESLAKNSNKSLRSRHIHRVSISENTETNFSLYHVNKKNILSDHYFIGSPLINTTWHTTMWLGYVILNASAIYLPESTHLLPKHCRPSWVPKAIPFQEYERGTGGITVSVFKMTPVGFRIENRNIDKSAFNHEKRFRDI